MDILMIPSLVLGVNVLHPLLDLISSSYVSDLNNDTICHLSSSSTVKTIRLLHVRSITQPMLPAV